MPGDSIPTRTYAAAIGLSLLANVGMVGSMATLGKAQPAALVDGALGDPVSIILPEPTLPMASEDAAPVPPTEPSPALPDRVGVAPRPEPAAPVTPPDDELSIKLGNPDAPDSSTKAWLGVSAHPTQGGLHASVDQAQFQPGRPGQPGPAEDAAPPLPEASRSPADAALQSQPQPHAEPSSSAPAAQGAKPGQADPAQPPDINDPAVGPLTPRDELQPRPEREANGPEQSASPASTEPTKPPQPETAPSKPADARPVASPRPSTSAKPSAPAGDGGLGDEREADAFTAAEMVDYRPGRPLAGRGLKIITVRPVYSLATLAVRSPRVALVRIVFGRDGKVLRAAFVDGRDAGHRDFNEPLMDAVHRWRAEGPQLLKLPQDKPSAGLAVTIRFEMF